MIWKGTIDVAFWSKVMAGLRAFKEAYMSVDVLLDQDFGDFEVRKLRYQIYWAFFENTIYRDRIHSWATSYRHQYALYKYIRSIYNPSYRLGDFWKIHLMGGLLDPMAGDGRVEPSALPIIIPQDNPKEIPLRNALSQLWSWSNLQNCKDIFTLYGVVMGDVGLKVVDDRTRKKVYLEVVHPGLIKSIDLDPFGNIKAYEFEEERFHPENNNKVVTYNEVATRDGNDVVYRTLLDGKIYPWNGSEGEWTEPYGFVPLVVTKHNDVGADWGWSEFHPARSKFHEVDDISSALSDQIRKTVNVVWLFTGQNKPKDPLLLTGTDSSTVSPYPGREEINALYAGSPQADAKALVAPLDLANTLGYLSSLLTRLEEDYPELRYEKLRISNVSAETIREARKPVKEKVNQRRAGYDYALARAQQMAVAIGGYRGIFEGFGLDSYEAGHLEHHIGKRPAFTPDPIADLEKTQLLWKAAEQAGKAGVPLEAFLHLQGWNQEQIDKIVDSEEYRRKQEIKDQALIGLGMIEQPSFEEGEEGEEGDDEA